MNLELYGIFETSFNLQNADIVDLWMPVSGTLDNVFRHKQVNFYEQLAKELWSDKGEVDLIISNPPWIPATVLANQEQNPAENAVYDEKERFLMSTLNFAKHHLSPKGQLLLIYSDLAFNLDL